MSNKPNVRNKTLPNGVTEKEKSQNNQNRKDQKTKDLKKWVGKQVISMYINLIYVH